MKLDKHVVDMFTELTKPADDVKMEKTCYGTISVVDGTRYVKLDGSDLLVPAASTVKTSHGDRVTVLMKNHSLTVTGNLTAPATDGEGGSSGEAGTAATIEVGTVTTGEAGSSASVTNSGTTSAAVFDFVIPRGDKGEKGDTGPQGPQGEKGDTGTWDGTIPEHEHTVSDITDFPTSLPANGGNADTVDGKHASDFALKTDIPTTLPANGGISDTARETVSPNGKALLWEDGEGGNLKLISPDGNHSMEMDLFNNAGFRMYFTDNGELTFPVDYNSTTKKFNINGNADTADKVNSLHGGIHYTGNRDIFSATLSNDNPCWNRWVSIMGDTNDPSSSQYIPNSPDGEIAGDVWYEVLTGGVSDRAFQLVIGCYVHQRKVFIRYKHDSGWSRWYNIADGGDADTVDGFHANEIASNPNLLINPDFRINQRGISSPTAAFGVDRWIGTYTVSDNTIVFSQTEQYMIQLIENIDSLIGREATATVYYDDGTADKGTAAISDTTYFFATSRTHCLVYAENGIKGLEIWAAAPCNIVGVKLELGGIATPFVPPDPATELAKCQRYYASHFVVKNGFYGTAYADRTNCARLTVALPATTCKLPTIIYTADNLVLFDGINHIGITALEIHTNMGNRATLSVIAEGLTVGKSYLLLATDSTTIAYSAEL